MKDNKTIGFDILDNAGLDKIDQIGTDTDMLDEKTKKRILEMTRKRFNDAIKGEDKMTFNNDINESAEIVENVEVYKRSKISKIMTRVINTAAVAGIAAGSVFLVKNINRDNKPVEPDLPAVSSTEDGELTAEEKARNQRIEEYIQELYNQFGMSDEDRFYDCLKIDYAYLDINNDSVDELFIRYDFLEAAADAKGIGLNYFDGTKYVHSYNVSETFKIDLNNRKLYDLAESHEGERWLDINTWENVEFSADSDFFTLQDNYFEIIDSFAENTYTHNNEPCTKEEYDKAIAEYKNCVGAELKFSPYDVKKAAKQPTANLSNEAAANQRIEDFIRHIYVSHNEVLDKETFDETLKIEYAYLDINNDSADELLVRYDFLKCYSYSGVECNYFNGTEYVKFDVLYGNTIKFDIPNRKLYEKYDGYENEFLMDVKTWENVEISSDKPYFTTQNNYHCYMSESNPDEIVYTRDGVAYPESEFKKVQAEFENLADTKLNYINYVPDDSFFMENSVNTPTNGLSAEETARNKRIEEYIDYLCYYCDGESDKDKFYDTIKIDYAYLDINNDSVDELLIRYHNLNDFSPYYEGTEINYFDGTKYIPVGETNTTFKFDLQNRKLYQLSESQEGGYWLFVRTWDEFSDDSDFFTFKEEYTSDIISFDPLEYTYSHNDTECSMEEYEKAMAEYENCVAAELNFNPYTVENRAVKKVINEFYTADRYETLSYIYPDLNSDGISELFILGKEFGSNLTTVGIYQLVNGEYVYKSESSYPSYKLDMYKKRIYYAEENNGKITNLYIETWNDNCDIIFIADLHVGDEEFDEYLADYLSCEKLNFENHKFW